MMAGNSTPPGSDAKRREWSQDEDDELHRLVDTHGAKNWVDISNMLPGRTGKQCRERWFNHLRGNIRHSTWSSEENALIMSAVAKYGKKWTTIVQLLPGRTENAVKNHWNSAVRRAYRRTAKALKQQGMDVPPDTMKREEERMIRGYWPGEDGPMLGSPSDLPALLPPAESGGGFVVGAVVAGETAPANSVEVTIPIVDAVLQPATAAPPAADVPPPTGAPPATDRVEAPPLPPALWPAAVFKEEQADAAGQHGGSSPAADSIADVNSASDDAAAKAALRNQLLNRLVNEGEGPVAQSLLDYQPCGTAAANGSC